MGCGVWGAGCGWSGDVSSFLFEAFFFSDPGPKRILVLKQLIRLAKHKQQRVDGLSSMIMSEVISKQEKGTSSLVALLDPTSDSVDLLYRSLLQNILHGAPPQLFRDLKAHLGNLGKASRSSGGSKKRSSNDLSDMKDTCVVLLSDALSASCSAEDLTDMAEMDMGLGSGDASGGKALRSQKKRRINDSNIEAATYDDIDRALSYFKTHKAKLKTAAVSW